MMRPDSRNRTEWIAHSHLLVIASGMALCVLSSQVHAQILGESSPGTPGAIDGELRLPRRSSPLMTTPDPALSGQQAPGKFGLRKNPNPAVRRPTGLGAPRNPAFAGASPMGQNRAQSQLPAARNPAQLSGSSMREPLSANESLPPMGRPSVAGVPAPGLRPLQLPNPRRPQLEQDPYAPIGVRAGTLILRPALEVGGGYDSNATRSNTRKPSSFYRTEAELKASSDWSQHKLDLDLRGAFTGYTSIENANRPEGDARLALRLDVTRDLAVESEIKTRFDTENSSSVNLPGGITGRTPFYTHAATLGATQRFGRLSLGLRGNIDRVIYGDADAVGGGIVDQSNRNYVGYGLRMRAGFEMTPGISPFLEAGGDRRTYDTNLDSSGYQRSSTGMTGRVGSTFELARTLTGEASLGYTFRAYEDARLAHMKAPLVDTALTWSISPLTTLNLRAQSEIAETTVAGSSGAYSYRTTATLTHAFLRNFTAAATLGLSKTDYDKIGRHETGYTGGLKLEYKFNRLMALRSSYQYEATRVNAAGAGYNAHIMMMGLRLTP